MDLKKLFTQRVNVIFGFGCLLPILNIAVSLIPTYIAELIILATGSALSASAEYWITFILPQFLYPIASALLFLIPLKMLRIKLRDAIEDKPSPISEYLIYVPMLMMLSYALTYVTNIVFAFLETVGISLPTVEGMIPQPTNALETLALFLVMSVLPAICEEFIYRITFVGVLSPISKGAAIILSSLAFGLMHATVQQIPFAFGLGIILALSYILTKNYRIPVLMHFINNFISCIFFILEGQTSVETAATVSYITVGVIYVTGMISIIFFIIDRSKNRCKEEPMTTTGQAMAAAVKAPMFWIFTAVYLLLTAVTTLIYMYMPA